MKKSITHFLILFFPSLLAAQNLVPAFGNQGIMSLNVSEVEKDAARALALDKAGNLHVFGSSLVYHNLDFSAIRLKADGSADPAFGTFGHTTVAIGTYDDEVAAACTDKNGNFLLAGFADSSPKRFGIARLKPNGLMDNTFSGSGYRVIQINTIEDRAKAVATEKNGKILVAGYTTVNTTNYAQNACLARLNQDGSTDNTFGKTGVAQITSGTYSQFYSLETDTLTNAIFAVGTTNNLTSFRDILLVKFKPNGTPDSSFAGTGVKRISTTGGTNTDDAMYVKLLSDGKLLVAGTSSVNSSESTQMVLRLNPDGSLDNTFGTNGIVLVNHVPGRSEYCYGACLGTDGKIFLSTISYQADKYTAYTTRLLPNGVPDVTFNKTGTATLTYSDGSASLSGIIADKQGNVSLAGTFYPASNLQSTSYLITRFANNGRPDSTYSPSGYRTYELEKGNDIPAELALGTNKTFYSAGTTTSQGGNQPFFLTKHLENGQLDNTFGNGGKVISGSAGGVQSLTYDPINKLIVSSEVNKGNYNLLLLKFKENGKPDSTFGLNGVVNQDITGSHDRIGKHFIDSEGKIVAGGFSFNTTDYDLTLSRYLANGILDNTFNMTGKLVLKATQVADYCMDLKEDVKGNYVIGGYSTGSSDANITVARVDHQGNPDPTFGTNGVVVLADAAKRSQYAYSFEFDKQQRIVLSGYEALSANSLHVVRLKPNGEPDSSFNGTGKATYPISISMYNFQTILQEDGKIVVLFEQYLSGTDYFKALRLHENGKIDSTFGINGLYTITTGMYASALITSKSEVLLSGQERKDIKLAKLSLPAIKTGSATEPAAERSATAFVYPNPNNGQFYINQSDVNVVITTLDGSIVYKETNYQKEKIQLFQKGMYVLQMSFRDGSTSSSKLLVE